ncbi:hypothetical protein P167DRAFT_159836 [Morchella conica CCBAS932]|uniref:Uncharacterized protein n=1 Tax=Morchella conica CCBAS932 TaxID=1392247 RepID=A0A3N4KSZ2_9PEZI|nr:hypothetical protein P167DRAFT_159836 [Morchella conica CCBAS932]
MALGGTFLDLLATALGLYLHRLKHPSSASSSVQLYISGHCGSWGGNQSRGFSTLCLPASKCSAAKHLVVVRYIRRLGYGGDVLVQAGSSQVVKVNL